jgi:hypothetical protein
MYSLDQFAATPPFSVLASIFLVISFDWVGLKFLICCGFLDGDCLNRRNWIRWQSPVIGSVLLAVALYPLALGGLAHFMIMQSVAITLLLLGCFHFFNSCYKRQIWLIDWLSCLAKVRRQSIVKHAFVLLLAGMGLTSLGPVTSADALDNHIGSAIAILNDGGLFGHYEWFHHRLSGNGEVLNALALSVGAEQFGSLLQYVSLLAIVGVMLFARPQSSMGLDKSESTYLIALAGVSAPILLVLVSAPKPQMWPISMTVLAFALTVSLSRRDPTRSKAMWDYSLVCMLVMVASQAKFNYILGGGIVGIMAVVVMAKQGYLKPAFYLGLLVGAAVLLPPIAFKAIAFDTNYVDALISPLPGSLPGTQEMVEFSQFNADVKSKLFFPLSILIPSHFGGYGSVLGIGWLLFAGIRPGNNFGLWIGVIASAIIVVANVFLAPPAARMYMEPYFWLLFVLSVQDRQLSGRIVKLVRWPLLAQSSLAIAAFWFGAVSLFPGALVPSWRTTVMERSANGYEIMQWVDKVLPDNAVMLNGHRSMALAPREAVSLEWVNFVDMKAPETQYYFDRLIDRKVSYILVIGPINYDTDLAGCYGEVVAGPGIGHLATRNPFNQGAEYEAWVLEFESERLPKCAVGK